VLGRKPKHDDEGISMAAGTTTNQQDIHARLLAEISAAVAANDMRRAFEVANVLVSRGVSHPAIFNARGLWFQQTRRYQEALENFQRALSMSPGNPTILNAVGLSLLKLERHEEAIMAFDAALAVAPDIPHTHYRKGLSLAAAGEHGAAEAAHRQAIELDPDFAEPLASLASILARKGEPEKAQVLADRALAIQPDNSTAIVALAMLDLSAKRYTEAEQRLRPLLELDSLGPQPRSAVFALIGDALDGQERYTEAFKSYIQENDELLRMHSQRLPRSLAIEAAENLTRYFETTDAERWRAPDAGGSFDGSPAVHVFLLGFVRSGTTLLEQILASNSRIVALEEKGLLTGLGDRYLTSIPALDSLAFMRGRELEQNRRLYWDRVRQSGLDIAGKIFVDKQPLNTVKLPLIAKLFPKAKVLLAIRDPRDVVLSCFRRQFKVNATMYEFLRLESSAQFYAAVMRLAEVYRQKLPLNLYEHRYEDMVQDFEGQVRAVCDFVGVEWDDSMRNFNKHAPAVDLRSPSARQVRKSLYSDGIAQWRRYKDELAPILPILRPWAEKFGYPPD
jgi:Tfp pilus assembly protein PilF